MQPPPQPEVSLPPQPAAELAPTNRFIEQMGLVCEGEGMPRIAGRLIGLFLVEGTTMSLSSIAERLGISRASASTNARMLAAIGIVERVGVPGRRRQDFYALASNPYHRLLSAAVSRMKRVHAFLSEASETLLTAQPDAQRRVRKLASFYGAASDALTKLLESLVNPATKSR